MPVQIPFDTIEYDFIDSAYQAVANISQIVLNETNETIQNSKSVKANNSSSYISLLRISSNNSSNILELEYDKTSQEAKLNISIVGFSLSISSIIGLIIYVIKIKNNY